MGTNRQHKNSVFTWLFSNPDTLRELYEALHGITLPPNVPITLNTLKGVLFKGRVNDLSFQIGGKLVILLEHQSTINPNMALRILLYIARVYEKIIRARSIYTGKVIKIPYPEFFVLYNGIEPYPDETVIKLSDSFEDAAAFGVPGSGKPDLELKVKVYNINEGHNEGILTKSKTLRGYSFFIEKIRGFEKEGADKEEAMKGAIKYCIEHNILKGFLEPHASEVFNMLMTEWNWDDALAVQREEGIEMGIKKGREEGREEGWTALAALLRDGKTLDEAMVILKGGRNTVGSEQ